MGGGDGVVRNSSSGGERGIAGPKVTGSNPVCSFFITRESRSQGTAQDVIGGALGNAQPQHRWLHVVLHYDHLPQQRLAHILKTLVIDTLPSRRLVRSLPGVLLLSSVLGAALSGPVLGTAAMTATDEAALGVEFSLAVPFGHLAETRFARVRKGLHAAPTTSIFGVESWRRSSFLAALVAGRRRILPLHQHLR